MVIQSINNGLQRFPGIEKKQSINLKKLREVQAMEFQTEQILKERLQLSQLGWLIGQYIHQLTDMEKQELMRFGTIVYQDLRNRDFDPVSAVENIPYTLQKMAEQKGVDLETLFVDMQDQFENMRQLLGSHNVLIEKSFMVPADMWGILFQPAGQHNHW